MLFGFFRRTRFKPTPLPEDLTPQQQQEMQELLSRIGLQIVRESRGPVPLLVFGRKVLERLEVPPPVPLPYFSAALKNVIQRMEHERLKVLSPTEFLGVGYVYNAADPDTWPFRSKW